MYGDSESNSMLQNIVYIYPKMVASIIARN